MTWQGIYMYVHNLASLPGLQRRRALYSVQRPVIETNIENWTSTRSLVGDSTYGIHVMCRLCSCGEKKVNYHCHLSSKISTLSVFPPKISLTVHPPTTISWSLGRVTAKHHDLLFFIQLMMCHKSVRESYLLT